MRLNEVANQPAHGAHKEAETLTTHIFDVVEAVMVKGNPLEAAGTLRTSLWSSNIVQVSARGPSYSLRLRMILPREAVAIDRDVLDIQLRRLINRLTRPISKGTIMDRIEPHDDPVTITPGHGSPALVSINLKLVPKEVEARNDHWSFMLRLGELPEKVWDIERSRA
jgi:hypothetical protein